MWLLQGPFWFFLLSRPSHRAWIPFDGSCLRSCWSFVHRVLETGRKWERNWGRAKHSLLSISASGRVLGSSNQWRPLSSHWPELANGNNVSQMFYRHSETTLPGRKKILAFGKTISFLSQFIWFLTTFQTSQKHRGYWRGRDGPLVEHAAVLIKIRVMFLRNKRTVVFG